MAAIAQADDVFLYLGFKSINHDQKYIFFSHFNQKEHDEVSDITREIMNVLIHNDMFELNQIILIFTRLNDNSNVIITVLCHQEHQSQFEPYEQDYLALFKDAFLDFNERDKDFIIVFNGEYYKVFQSPDDGKKLVINYSFEHNNYDFLSVKTVFFKSCKPIK